MRSYQVRVRGKTYIWGGADIAKKLENGLPPLLMTIKNDDFGEPVVIRTEWLKPGGGKEDKDDWGRIARGQSFTVQLNDYTGIYALQENGRPTILTCQIHREE